MVNRGLEFGLTTVNIDSRKADGFRWTTTLNMGFNRNKVTALFNGQPFYDGIRSINRVAVGQPIGAFYTLNFLGVDPATGDAIFQDLNGDGTINSDDLPSSAARIPTTPVASPARSPRKGSISSGS